MAPVRFGSTLAKHIRRVRARGQRLGQKPSAASWPVVSSGGAVLAGPSRARALGGVPCAVGSASTPRAGRRAARNNTTLLPTTGFSPIQRWYLSRRFHKLPLPVAAELSRYTYPSLFLTALSILPHGKVSHRL